MDEPDDDGIKIYFRGNLAKHYNRLKEKQDWVANCLDTIEEEIKR